MLRRLNNVFKRYVAAHAVVSNDHPIPLALPNGNEIGYVDKLNYYEQHLHVSGWSLLGQMHLVSGRSRQKLTSKLDRPDVAISKADLIEKLGVHGNRFGFAADMRWEGDEVSLQVRHGHDVIHIDLPVPDARMMRRQRRAAIAPFTAKMLQLLPHLVRYLVNGGDRDIQRQVRIALGVGVIRHDHVLLDETLFAPADQHEVETPPISIIVPVYNAFELLQECLDRVVRHTHTPWHLIVVEDRSTDERVRPWLRDWAAAQGARVTLLENEQNLGFIGGVNRGLAEAMRRGEHVVLLNSDALVPDGWSSRLLRPLVEDSTIASVTPMSNDATIFSVPLIGMERPLETRKADEIDQIAQKISAGIVAEAPTGVGFCMAMSKAAIKLEPRLDTAFGKGYGEEVDWCQKLRQAGMRHVGIGNLFVEHRGGQSFGSDTKTKAIAASGKILSTRYPNFDLDVQSFFLHDPLIGPRMALAMAWLAAEGSKPVPVYFAHSMGGGAEHWLRDQIEKRMDSDKASIVLRFGGNHRFRLELHLHGQVMAVEVDNLAMVQRLLAPLTHRQIVYSCAVGDNVPIEVPEYLLKLSGMPDARLNILMHDYFPISPSYTLTGSDGRFSGLPDPETTDPVHLPILADGSRGTLAQWQESWGRAVLAADQIITFSASSAEYVRAVWPETAGRISVRPHELHASVPHIDASDWQNSGPGTIAVLGGIGPEKGAQVLVDLGNYLHGRPNAPRLVLIGEIAPKFALPKSVVVTGRYDVSELASLVKRYKVTSWLMPSIWPETFSFTTHEMLATGLPVFSFDLGAQAEAVKRAPNGYILTSAEPAEICRQIAEGPASRVIDWPLQKQG